MDIDELRQEIENANDVDDLSPKAEQQVRALSGIAKSWFQLRELTQDIFDKGDDKSKLQEMLDEQAELSDRIKSEHNLVYKDSSWINLLCNAMSNEVEELRDTTPWKYWSKNEEFEREEAKGEAIDILHFLLQVFDELGMDAEDIYNEYMEKNEVNHCRQDGDY